MLTDADIRAPLLAALRTVPGQWVREEVPLWASRVDVVTVDTDALTAWEIKSDVDSFRRIARDGFQAHSYGRVCDRVVLVTTLRHFYRARTLVPNWWGLWIAYEGDEGARFRQEFAPQPNQDLLPRGVADLLYVSELRTFAAELGVRRGARSKGDLVDRVLAAASLDDIRARVRQCWRVRDWDARRAGGAS